MRQIYGKMGEMRFPDGKWFIISREEFLSTYILSGGVNVKFSQFQVEIKNNPDPGLSYVILIKTVDIQSETILWKMVCKNRQNIVKWTNMDPVKDKNTQGYVHMVLYVYLKVFIFLLMLAYHFMYVDVTGTRIDGWMQATKPIIPPQEISNTVSLLIYIKIWWRTPQAIHRYYKPSPRTFHG